MAPLSLKETGPINAYLFWSVVSDITRYGQGAVGTQKRELLANSSQLAGESLMEVRFRGWIGVCQAEKGGNKSSKQRKLHKPKLRKP